MATPESILLRAVINHVLLPPDLPNAADSRPEIINIELIKRFRLACDDLRQATENIFSRELNSLISSLDHCHLIHLSHSLDANSLEQTFSGLREGQILIFHVVAQNSGLLVYRDTSNVTFEAFEVSADSVAVLACTGSLQWQFPTSAATIPHHVFDDRAFQRSLADFLERASTETIGEFAAVAVKARSHVREQRHTTNPALVTSLLITLLGGIGQQATVKSIRKRVRDEVRFKDSELPWRRSPFYLLLRIGINRQLRNVANPVDVEPLYKSIVALVHASLLDDSTQVLSPELSHSLLTKLCRRIAKLEKGRSRQVDGSLAFQHYSLILSKLSPRFFRTVQNALQALQTTWDQHKTHVERKIYPLRSRTAPPYSLRLTLSNSKPHFAAIRQSWLRPEIMEDYVMPSNLRAFIRKYSNIADAEEKAASYSEIIATENLHHPTAVLKLTRELHDYMSNSVDCYDIGTEERSRMLLTVMWMWMMLDKTMIDLYPSLSNFHPIFRQSILDCLRLSRPADLLRLCKIQSHLRERHLSRPPGKLRTIFDVPTYGCFADENHKHPSADQALHRLLRQIELVTATRVSDKYEEWTTIHSEHERLTREISQLNCQFVIVVVVAIEDEEEVLEHDPKCRKCLLTRKAEKMRIQRIEKPLPLNTGETNAVLWELLQPEHFAAYRDITWRIAVNLGLPDLQASTRKPHKFVQDYYACFNASKAANVTLGSKTKSFLQTHFQYGHFPISFEQVCVNNGLKFEFYDQVSETWPAEHLRSISFDHHCSVIVSQNNGYGKIEFPRRVISCGQLFGTQTKRIFLAANGKITSNEIIATQPSCPQTLALKEVIAFQTLVCDDNLYWPTLLVELGSSNLNFNTEAVMLLTRTLCQRTSGGHGEAMHVSNMVFEDESFCVALLEQIETKLRLISMNWRENYCMEIMIMLILKLFLMGQEMVRLRAIALLEYARTCTIRWVRGLRKEYWSTTEQSAARRVSQMILWAALLCRRTYTTWSLPQEHVPSKHITEKALSIFIEASICMHELSHAYPDKQSSVLRSILIRDVQMVHRLQPTIRFSLETSPRALVLAAIKTKIISPHQQVDPGARITFRDEDGGSWAEVILGSDAYVDTQTMRFNLVAGALLLDGRVTQSELPVRYRDSPTILQLFPSQKLKVNPSAVGGMTYKVGLNVENYEIHLGFRRGELVVRALAPDQLLELIPTTIYDGPGFIDLPFSLLENSVHWLNLTTNVVEIRKQPKIWRRSVGNWHIDLQSHTAYKGGGSRQGPTLLIDPCSSLFKYIASTLNGFEEPRHIIIEQRPWASLKVSLPRFDLSFFVNSAGLLESLELQAEIDTIQDAGVWYGLTSKVVLRDVVNQCKRSIITPLGPTTVERKGIHVRVSVQASGIYGQFFLQQEVGRLSCATEPRLYYTMALYHALTSFCLPDPLTGKTGKQEACRILCSARCQPYAPLIEAHHWILDEISNLSPVREYYPTDLKVMETVSWKPRNTVSIQDDRYKVMVDHIRDASKMLSIFEVGENLPDGRSTTVIPERAASHVEHLAERYTWRQQSFERSSLTSPPRSGCSDEVYNTRGYVEFTCRQELVLEAAHLIEKWSTKQPSPIALVLLMQRWGQIQGYGDGSTFYDKLRLSDQLSTDVASCWGSLVNRFRMADESQKYPLLFLAATLSFGEATDRGAMQTLIAFAVLEDLRTLKLPTWPNYTQFRCGWVPKVDYLVRLLCGCHHKFTSQSTLYMTQKARKLLSSAMRAHELQVNEEMVTLASSLCDQWPCAPSALTFVPLSTIDTEKAQSLVLPEWHAMFQNFEFEKHLGQTQAILNAHRVALPQHGTFAPEINRQLKLQRCPPFSPINVLDRNIDSGATLFGSSYIPNHQRTAPSTKNAGSDDTRELCRILDELPVSCSITRTEYIESLRKSVCALDLHRSSEATAPFLFNIAKCRADIARLGTQVAQTFSDLSHAIKKLEPGSAWLEIAGIWPINMPIDLLETLSTSLKIPLKKCVKRSIISLGILITKLQRMLRMQDSYLRDKRQLLQDELKNLGHTNWDPAEYPDWLLLEIDADVLIRPVQIDVALATIASHSGSNSVLQLNMGQGKTSLIIPLVVSVLANGKSLCRVIVPKSLLLQTAQLLQSRLGGFLNRQLRHLPFSRRTPCTREIIEGYLKVHKAMLESSGVIIALPEHLMSFMLSGPQYLSDDRLPEATCLIHVQQWISRHCRDVLDECDHTMAVKTQLIYPSGPQITVDGANHRWGTIQAILQLVKLQLHDLEKNYPSGVQVVDRKNGAYPFIYFLKQDAQEALMQGLLTSICAGGLPTLKTDTFSASEKKSIRLFISRTSPDKAVLQHVWTIANANPMVGYVVYLLRGLFVHRILLLCLSRRWNVQYGLHPDRDPMAVPFHAKGIPSNLAEWGHVEVSLLFTCLSFYYTGLSQDQLRKSLEIVLKSDDPAREFEEWAQGSKSLSDSYRDCTSINLGDNSQVLDFWNKARFNMQVINHFLNHVVFPKHAKQFKIKLQVSGWDLPLKGEGFNLTTGFSGTNDNRLVLPLTIKQDDLSSLAHTNAEVLTYLLHSRNRHYSLLGRREFRPDGTLLFRRFSEAEFLVKLASKGIRVLIDCGAAILEMTNFLLAKTWLEIDGSAKAAVFFNEQNRAMVMSRNGWKQIPLLASPYADDLKDCLVYLDESHTRGTDMKFSPDARGAITLSLGQTKDHTVQAVMRLRQLSTTQSVTFFAPPEVHQSILDFKKTPGNHIDSHDVICWLLEQTIQGLENLQPLFYAQGMDYCRRVQARANNAHYLTDHYQRQEYLGVLQESEQQTLKSLYEPRDSKNCRKHLSHRQSSKDQKIIGFRKELQRRKKVFQDTGSAVHASALQEVEQEREVAVEAENIREKQVPVRYHPHTFAGLNENLAYFVRTGELPTGRAGCEQVYMSLRETVLGIKYKVGLPTTSKFLASSEFRKTIHGSSAKHNDDFLRPAQWLLWSMSEETAILISPEEAELLRPICCSSPKQVVHLLSYAAPVTRKMLQFNDLRYYAVPTLPDEWKAPMWLRVELGIFAGRLYFPFEELVHITDFLGISPVEATSSNSYDTDESETVMDSAEDTLAEDASSDDFEDEIDTKPSMRINLTQVKMLNFLQAWLAMRSKGQDFDETPMGYICTRKPLNDSHPFFKEAKDEDEIRAHSSLYGVAADGLEVGEEKVDQGDEDNDGSDFEDDELHAGQRLTAEEMKAQQDAHGAKDEEVYVDVENQRSNSNDVEQA